MAENIEWSEAEGFPLAGTYIGPQAVLEGVFMRLGEIGDEFAAVPDQIVAEGDTVVALGNYSWKHKSSEASAVVKMAHVWTVADGQLATFQQHVDTVRVRELSSSACATGRSRATCGGRPRRRRNRDSSHVLERVTVRRGAVLCGVGRLTRAVDIEHLAHSGDRCRGDGERSFQGGAGADDGNR